MKTLTSHKKNLSYFLFVICFVFQASIVSPVTAQKKPQLEFQYGKDNVTYNAVYNALKDDELMASFNEMFPGNRPPIAIARYDLNADGRDEFIAKLNETTLFCNNTDTCPFIIFTNTQKGLIKIGQFNAAGLEIARTKTSGIHDIFVYPTADKKQGMYYYKWAGRSYKPVN